MALNQGEITTDDLRRKTRIMTAKLKKIDAWIVKAMTLQEIHEELFKDFPSFNGKINHFRKEFRRKVD